MKKHNICILKEKAMQMLYSFLVIVSLVSCHSNAGDQVKEPTSPAKEILKVGDIPIPEGYQRITAEQHSFVRYSRNIGIKKDRTVYLFNGVEKGNQTAQYAVLDIDIGTKDLQQCADAAMRLRSEYLFENKNFKAIYFQFTNGFICDYTHYANGYRITFSGNSCSWIKQSAVDLSHKNFRNYLDLVYAYAGTKSLFSQMKRIPFSHIAPGTVLLQKREPYGHAVTVMDMAYNSKTKDTIYLLSQSYMPAQDIHVLRNPTNEDLSPWYSIHAGQVISTPEWSFTKDDLKEF